MWKAEVLRMVRRRTADKAAPTDSVALWVHSLLIVSSMTQSAILPMLPLLQHDLEISASTLSFLLALPTLTMIVASVPVGWLSDRLGARQLTLIATIVLMVSCILQALPGLTIFTVGRFVFGLAFTAIWTSGPAWLSDPSRSTNSRVGAVVTSSAAGSIAGPLVAGAVADRFGLGAPFAIFAAASAFLVVPLSMTQRRHALAERATMRWTTVTHQFARSSELQAALAAMITVGAVAGAIQLLVPLQLHRAGQSATAIGLAFSASGVVYVIASVYASRARGGTASAAAVVAGCLVMALAGAPTAFSDSSVVVVTCLLAITLPRSQLNTISYRLATAPGSTYRANVGLVMGLLNLVWAISMSVGPIAAAWLSSSLGPKAAFAATALWAAGVGIALAILLRHRGRHPVAIDDSARVTPVPSAMGSSGGPPAV